MPRTQPPHPLLAAGYKMSPRLSAFKYANPRLRVKYFFNIQACEKTFCIEQKSWQILFFFLVCKLTTGSYFVSNALTQAAQWHPVTVKSNVTGGRQRYQTEMTRFLPPFSSDRDADWATGWFFLSYPRFCLSTRKYSQWTKIYLKQMQTDKELCVLIFLFFQTVGPWGVGRYLRGAAFCLQGNFGTRSLKSSPKGFSVLRLKDGEVLHSSEQRAPPTSILFPPPLSAFALPYPHSRPSAPTAAPFAPPPRNNGPLWKKSRKKEEPGVTELPVCWRNL